MKKSVLTSKNAPLELWDSEIPKVPPGYSLIKLKAAALNHRDIWIQKGLYAGIKYPITLGSDGSGICVEQNNISKFDNSEKFTDNFLNKEVIIQPGMNWGINQEVQGPEYKILGLPDDGTFAEYVLVPTQNLYPKPEHLTFEEAAAFPLAGSTAYRSLFYRGNFKTNERILITGIGGGVSQMVLLFCKGMDCLKVVSSSSDDKLEKALNMGADIGINYKKGDWITTFKEKIGKVDLIIDGSAGDTFGNYFDLLDSGGRIVFYGGTGMIPQLSPQKIFWKQLSILGSTMGSTHDFNNMIELINSSKIKPTIDRVFPFNDINHAFTRLGLGEQFGKVIISFD